MTNPSSRLPLRGLAALGLCATFSLVAAPAVHAQTRPLGRLFNTPQERAQLDARRAGGETPSASSAPLPRPAPEPLQLNGVVLRSGGQATVWVNQSPAPDSSVNVRKDRSVSLHLPSGRRIILKPGQSYNETTGTISNIGSGNATE
jgi:hypothetical protein